MIVLITPSPENEDERNRPPSPARLIVMKKITVLLALALTLAACGAGGGGPDEPVDDTTPTTTPTVPVEDSIPDDAGPVFVDSTDIILMESFPVQVVLRVTGNLPTPCHRLAYEVEDDGTTIAARLASVAEADAVCAQVLEPFEFSIPLGDFESGSRQVTLNGQPVGDFEV
ncbi:MAG TPA: hypothetical protein VJR05_07500 [Acidimicrobiia bacterium]|nr:hypothetical protein [Acidimicrobiia bacterium]